MIFFDISHAVFLKVGLGNKYYISGPERRMDRVEGHTIPITKLARNEFFAAFAEAPHARIFAGISGEIASRSKASRDYDVNSFITAILA